MRICKNKFIGFVPFKLFLMSKRLKTMKYANIWHDYVQEEIEKLGYKTCREVAVKLDNGRNGRLDLVAKKGIK